MIRAGLILICGAAVAQGALPDDSEPVTLDFAEMARIWQEVKDGRPATPADQDAWQAAVQAEDEELARVLLLAWLQQHNPQVPMAVFAADYARVLRLHRLALSGNPAACAALAEACRSGFLGRLMLPVSEQKARWFEQRAVHAGNLPG